MARSAGAHEGVAHDRTALQSSHWGAPASAGRHLAVFNGRCSRVVAVGQIPPADRPALNGGSCYAPGKTRLFLVCGSYLAAKQIGDSTEILDVRFLTRREVFHHFHCVQCLVRRHVPQPIGLGV